MGKILLPLCLLGSVVSSVKTHSFAVFTPNIDNSLEHILTFARIGETFFDKTICDITARFTCIQDEFGRLQTIMNGNCLDDADFLEVKKGLDVSGNEVTVSKEYKESLSSGIGLARTLMQAGVLQSKDGFSIWDIEEDSIYHDVGLKNGDVITAINGSKLVSADVAIRILLNVRSEDHWQLDILRMGEPLVIQITVK